MGRFRSRVADSGRGGWQEDTVGVCRIADTDIMVPYSCSIMDVNSVKISYQEIYIYIYIYIIYTYICVSIYTRISVRW